MFNPRFWVLFAAVLLPAVWAPAQTPAAAAPKSAPRGFVLLVGGTPGTPMHARLYADWLGRFRAHFAAAGVAAGDLVLLSPQTEIPGRTGDSAAAAVTDALAALAKRASPQDQFVLVLVGHGEPGGALAVPGPDLTPAQLADGLKGMPASSQIVLDFASCSGAAVPVLAKPGRVLVAATGEMETADSEFAEFFLLALEGKWPGTAELLTLSSGRDRPLPLLTVFNAASHEYALWVTRQRQDENGGWIVDGRRSRELYQKLYGAGDVPAAKRMAAGKGDGGDDVMVPLAPGDKPDAKIWSGRRLVNAHPLLEDTGTSDGASALDASGYKAIAGAKAGEVGFLARNTVPGRPGGAAP